MKNGRVFFVAACVVPMMVVLLGMPQVVAACPFCEVVSRTMTEEVAGSDVAVLVELVDRPEQSEDASELPSSLQALELTKSTFRVIKVYGGKENIDVEKPIKALYFGDQEPGSVFLLLGIEPESIKWRIPIELSERSRKYLETVLSMPPEGKERLAFFQDYLQDEDDLIKRDSFDEFARAPMSALLEIKDKMNREQLLKWITDPKVITTNRRLYFTMLSVCGKSEDATMLEEMIKSDDQKKWQGLDALISCYLTLTKEQGLPLIEKRFLANAEMEYMQVYAALMALRIHGEEFQVIPRKRLTASMRMVLDRVDMADLVIRDLARWEDWDSVDRLVRLFKESDKESNWVRVPVIIFLQQCPLPKAKEHLKELAKIDPRAMKRASMSFPLPMRGPSKSKDKPSDSKDKKVDESDTKKSAQTADDAEKVAPVVAAAKPAIASEVPADAREEPADAPSVSTKSTPVSAESSVAAPYQVYGLSTRWWVTLMSVGGGSLLFIAYWLILRRSAEPVAGMSRRTSGA